MKTVDDYLASVTPEAREALQALRGIIRSVVPDAEEVISYGVPTFRHGGGLVAFGAAKRHCGFYVMSLAVMETHRSDLEGFETAKATVRFTPSQPLPEALVQKIVLARVAENEANARRKSRSSAEGT
ncbi:MAG: iron chaperone [Fimbriimonas sp.]